MLLQGALIEILLTPFFLFVLGTMVGSFLNVVILRLNTGKSLGGRSFCDSCGTTLSWPDLIPVLSFIGLRARCRRCGSGLSLQYPLVELLTGASFVAIHYALIELFFSLSYALTLLFIAVVISLIIVIFVYDIRHTIIPDVPVYALIALSIIALFVSEISPVSFAAPDVMNALAGPLTALPLAFLWLVSRGRWMGLGDAKLQLALGWLLGASKGFTALIFSFWIGAVVSLVLLALSNVVQETRLLGKGMRLTIKSEIPFAPFLIIGFILVWLFDINLVALFAL